MKKLLLSLLLLSSAAHGGIFGPSVSGNTTGGGVGGYVTAASIAAVGGVTNGAGIKNPSDKPLILDAQAIYNQNPNSGMNWGQMKNGWLMWYFAPGQGDGQQCVLTNLTYIQTNGTLYALTNAGVQLCAYFDVGWDYQRNTNWSSYVTNLSNLTWNTNLYPLGLPWLINTLHSNGIKVCVQLYASTNVTPAGASSLVVTPQGFFPTPWTNGSGTYLPDPSKPFGNGNTNYYVNLFTPDSIKYDFSTLQLWGADAVAVADPLVPLAEMENVNRVVSRACLEVQVPIGSGLNFPFTNYTSSYLANRTMNTGYSFQYYSPVVSTYAWPQGGMAYISFESANGQTRYSYGGQTRGSHSALWYDNNDQGSGSTGLKSIIRDLPQSRKAYEGSYIAFAGVSDTASLSVAALVHGIIGGGWANGSAQSYYGGFNASVAVATNAVWSRIHDDVEQNMPTLALSVDTATNKYSVFVTKLSGGAFAAGFFNEGTNLTAGATLNFSAIGIPSNTVYLVSWTDQNRGFVTNSYFVNTSSSTLALLEPVEPVQDVGQLVQFKKGVFINRSNVVDQNYFPADAVWAASGLGLGGSGWQNNGTWYQMFDSNPSFGTLVTARKNNTSGQLTLAFGGNYGGAITWGPYLDILNGTWYGPTTNNQSGVLNATNPANQISGTVTATGGNVVTNTQDNIRIGGVGVTNGTIVSGNITASGTLIRNVDIVFSGIVGNVRSGNTAGVIGFGGINQSVPAWYCDSANNGLNLRQSQPTSIGIPSQFMAAAYFTNVYVSGYYVGTNQQVIDSTGMLIQPTNANILSGVSGKVIQSFVGGTNYWVGDKGGGIFQTNHVP